MTLEAIVARYGLAALFLGAGLEGEAAVLAGGVLAHRGLFPLWAVMIAAAAGSFTADQLWFHLGRRFRDHPRVSRARAKPAFVRALALLERHPTAFIFAFRFLYGLRTISPIAIGTTTVSARVFVAVNLVSAILWGVTFSSIGYLFGHGLERLLGRSLHDSRAFVAIAIAVALGLAAVLVRRHRAA